MGKKKSEKSIGEEVEVERTETEKKLEELVTTKHDAFAPFLFNRGYDGENKIKSFFDKTRSPPRLYDFFTPSNILFPKYITPNIGASLVVREDGVIKKVVNSGEYLASPFKRIEIFSVYMGKIDHSLEIALGENPQDIGSRANITLSYNVSDATKCVELKSLEQSYLEQIISKNVCQSVRGHQISSGKRIFEFEEGDSNEIQEQLESQLSNKFTEAGFNLKGLQLNLLMPEIEMRKQQATRYIKSTGGFLEEKNRVERQQAEAKRAEEETKTRHEILVGRLRSEESMRVRKEYRDYQIEVVKASRELVDDLENSFLEKKEPISQVLIYQRISDLLGPLYGLNQLESTNPELFKENSVSGLVGKVLDSTLRERESPLPVKMAEGLKGILGNATINLRQGELNWSEIVEDVSQIFKKYLEKK